MRISNLWVLFSVKIPTNRIAVLDEGDLGKFEILKYLVYDNILFIFDGKKFVYTLVVTPLTFKNNHFDSFGL